MSGSAARLIMGINLAGGAAYLGVIECPDTPRPDIGTDRLLPSPALTGAEQLNDFRARFEQELRNVRPEHVAVMGTRRYGGWTYAHAFARVSMEAAIMIGAGITGVPYTAFRQEDAARAAGVAATALVPHAADILSLDEPPRYWNDRSMAFLAAWGVAKKEC